MVSLLFTGLFSPLTFRVLTLYSWYGVWVYVKKQDPLNSEISVDDLNTIVRFQQTNEEQRFANGGELLSSAKTTSLSGVFCPSLAATARVAAHMEKTLDTFF